MNDQSILPDPTQPDPTLPSPTENHRWGGEAASPRTSVPPSSSTEDHRWGGGEEADLETLDAIQRRILWLATQMIHYANHERANPDGSKIGGHQASCASVVTILTAVFFHFLQQGDRIAIKPHASPVFHAIQYLLGQLPRRYLTTLRDYQGLQAYPSRTKDHDRVDFSTGSVGLGAVAPAFAALAHQYTQAHFGNTPPPQRWSSVGEGRGEVRQHGVRRFIALVGDAELDEGNVWEALMDEALTGLENLIWIVDLNRQSLDRVVPGIRADLLKRLFADNHWRVVEVKYGRRLQALFNLPGGGALRQRIDDMSNEEYQALIRLPGEQLRPGLAQGRADLEALLKDTPDAELPDVLMNLGGHDLAEMISGLEQAVDNPCEPTVIFAYTIKGWGLPIAGHPLNHSMLLNAAQMQNLQASLGVPAGGEWDAFAPTSPAGRLCQQVSDRLYPAAEEAERTKEAAQWEKEAAHFLARSSTLHSPLPNVDPSPGKARVASPLPNGDLPLGRAGVGSPLPNSDLPLGRAAVQTTARVGSPAYASTQETFGRLLYRLADQPDLCARLVTASPDVSVSTNLTGWINKRGAFSLVEMPDYDTDPQRLLKWKRGPSGQHIELGISEMNLFLLLGMFGLSAELCGQLTIPIGTVYDPFVCRGLDALIYALYSQSKFVFAGTPSGISLSPEGGAHQSSITPSIGTELPNLRMYEPGFACEVEWILLDSIAQCFDRQHGRASYLRLSTKQVDQNLIAPALQRLGENALRTQTLAGGYRLRDWRQGGTEADPRYVVQIAASGAMLPEACAAAEALWQEGVAANVLNLTSPRRLYETWRAHKSGAAGVQPADSLWEWLIPPGERRAPIISVLDGASHSLAWLGSVFGAPVHPLGVDDFGQSGSRPALYHHYRIDADAILAAALDALDE